MCVSPGPWRAVPSSPSTQPMRRTRNGPRPSCVPFDRLDPATDRPPARRRRDAVIRGTLHALSRARPERVLWAAPVARMDLLPWQLAPALAVLGGVTRLLLADAVGLGKTIQAGLVLAELRARGLVERALILVPAGLRPAWAAELKTRFELPVEILDLPAILELERTGAVGANPWNRTPLIVSSLDLVKRAEVLQAVELAPLDLLIVDEAHHATPGTDRHAAVSRLAGQVPWLVLASATPHSGDAAAYRALLALGAVGSPPVDRLCVFRRTHGEVRFSVASRTHILRVQAVRRGTAVTRCGAGLCARALPGAGGRDAGRAAAGGRAGPAGIVLALGDSPDPAPEARGPGGRATDAHRPPSRSCPGRNSTRRRAASRRGCRSPAWSTPPPSGNACGSWCSWLTRPDLGGPRACGCSGSCGSWVSR